MKALVTGGGGFLGSAVVRQLRDRGDAVRSCSRQRYAHLDAWGVEQVTADLSDEAAIDAAVRGVDVVFHVAAKAGVWGPYREYHRANVIGTANVILACRRHGVRKLVFTSSPSVTFAGTDQIGVDESAPYPRRFLAAYPETKAIAERLALEANGRELAVAALRPHLIWGPGDPHLIPRLIQRGRAGKLRRIGRAPKLVDTIYVDNAASAHLSAADRLTPGAPPAGKAYFLSQGAPEPLWDFLNRILVLAGVSPVTRQIGPRKAYAVGAVLEGLYRLLGRRAEPPITRFVAKQLSTAHWFDLSAARRDLGYVPAVSTEEGLRRWAEWYRAESDASTH